MKIGRIAVVVMAMGATLLIPISPAIGDLLCPPGAELIGIGPQHLVAGPNSDDPPMLYVTYTADDQIGRVHLDTSVNPPELVADAINSTQGPGVGDGTGPHRILRRGSQVWYSLPTSDQIGRMPLGFPAAEFQADRFPEDPDMSELCNPVGIEEDSNGNLWVAEIETDTVSRFNVLTGLFDQFPLPPAFEGGGPQELASAGDYMWFTGRRSTDPVWLGRININSPPGQGMVDGPFTKGGMSGPHGIVPGPDGRLYFTEFTGQGAISRVTGPAGANPVIRRCVLPRHTTDLVIGPDEGLPDEGFHVYFTEAGTNKVGRITVSTALDFEQCAQTAKRKQLSDIPIDSTPKGITLGADGNIWFTLADHSAIGKWDLSTNKILECPLPTIDGGSTVCHRPDTTLPDASGALLIGNDELMPALVSPSDCQAISHDLTGVLAGSVPDPDTGLPVPLTGTLTLGASVACETLSGGTGSVTSASISDPSFTFAYESGGAFSRSGSSLLATAQGMCTLLTLEYECEMVVDGVWSPIYDLLDHTRIIGATLTTATFLVQAI
jgi:streptogramin lyase